MCNRRGFIEFRTLIALIIMLSALPISVSTITYAANLKFEFDKVNDEISLYQLRRILLIAYDIDNYGNSLEFIYHNDNYSLNLINNRLVLQPGYQMFLDKVDYINFYEEGNAVWIEYEKGNKKYCTPIVKRNGIYIDDFSDFDDDDDYDSYNDG